MPPELQAHLDKLRAKLEQDRYNAMMADVPTAVRDRTAAAAAASEVGLVTYKQQMSFGMHVVVTMGAFYAFGHVAGMALTRNKALHPVCGLVLMVTGLLLETLLYVVRTNLPPPLPPISSRAERRDGRLYEVGRDDGKARPGASSSPPPRQPADKKRD